MMVSLPNSTGHSAGRARFEHVSVEDGSADDLGLAHKLDGGPLKAIREYLASPGALFRVDRSYCDFYGRNATGNAEGYLRRV